MHTPLASIHAVRDAPNATAGGCMNVRVPPPHIPIATGRKRSGRRLLTVGTDCALGKKYTALSLARAFAATWRGGGFPRHRPNRHHDRGAACRWMPW